MDALPDEIIVYLFSFLTPPEITTTHLVCRRFLRIGRDNNLWRDECFEISRFAVNLRRRKRAEQIPTNSAIKPRFGDLRGDGTEGQPGQRSVTSVARHEWHSSNQRATERIRVMANWDPSYQAEKVDWYTEFIHRTAPICIKWFQKPLKEGGGTESLLEVRGIGAHYLPGSEDLEMTIAQLEDGSVCLWDVKGSIIGRSAEGSLRGIGRKDSTCGITDGISVNSDMNRAFIAVEQDVVEVDLQTLRTVSQTRYPSSISAMSEARGSTPITIGTNDDLHLYDPRSHQTGSPGNSELERLEGGQHEAPVFRMAPDLQKAYSIRRPFAKPVPLSILHMPSSGENTASDIFVAGRFTSIMNYDRRFLSRPRSVIHSGARLSALSYIPHSFSKDASASMRHSELSVGEVRSVKSTPGSTLIACGEYGGRGSLDLYGLSDLPNTPTTVGPGRTLQSAFKNRLASSTSIILSVTPHGSRLVFSDGNGNLKWVERDGLTEVRQWNISNEFPDNRPRGIFGTVDSEYEGSVDIARKLLPTKKYGAPAATNMDNLLLWSGEKIGLLQFSNKKNSGAADFEEVAKSLEERRHESSERAYRELTRRALEAQADEVRLMRGLGCPAPSLTPRLLPAGYNFPDYIVLASCFMMLQQKVGSTNQPTNSMVGCTIPWQLLAGESLWRIRSAPVVIGYGHCIHMALGLRPMHLSWSRCQIYLAFQLADILSRLPIGALDSQIQATCSIQTCSELYLRARSNASKVRPNEVVLVIL